jgi:hypothetical protein
MKTFMVVFSLLAGWPVAPLAAASPTPTVDLLGRYPSNLTGGDTDPSRARDWEFSGADVFHLSQFHLAVGTNFQVTTGPADLGIGHCADGAVWAVVVPRDQSELTSPAAGHPEAVAHVWLRFHPREINRLFPPETVFCNGASNLAPQMRLIANVKMGSSSQIRT